MDFSENRNERHNQGDLQMTYTKREIEIFIEGMKHARKLAIGTGKGHTASQAITSEIQHQNMRLSVAVHKGKIS